MSGLDKPTIICLYKVSGLTRPPIFIARITVPQNGFFSHAIIDAKVGEIFMLRNLAVAGEDDFPGNELVFSAADTQGLHIRWSDQRNLYNVVIVSSGQDNRMIITRFQNWENFFRISEEIRRNNSASKKDSLFQEILVLEDGYMALLQKALSSTQPPALTCVLLYLLARFQLASGQGNFAKYYRLVSGILPQTELTNDFKKLAASLEPH